MFDNPYNEEVNIYRQKQFKKISKKWLEYFHIFGGIFNTHVKMNKA